MKLQAEKLDQMLEKRREPLDAVVEFSIGRASAIFSSVSRILSRNLTADPNPEFLNADTNSISVKTALWCLQLLR
jgi:hypothetical protein